MEEDVEIMEMAGIMVEMTSMGAVTIMGVMTSMGAMSLMGGENMVIEMITEEGFQTVEVKVIRETIIRDMVDA